MELGLWVAIVLFAALEAGVSGRKIVLRRFVHLLPWFSAAVRATLALAAAALAPLSDAVVVMLVVVALGRLATAYARGVLQPRMRQEVLAVGLGRNDVRARDAGGEIARLSLVLDLVFAAFAVFDGEVAVVASLLVLLSGGAGLLDAVTVARWNRVHVGRVEQLGTALGGLRPRVVFYSAALPESVPNLEQWLPSLEVSGEVAYVLVREKGTLTRLAAKTSLPVVYLKALGALEDLVPSSVEVALYVDTSTRNNHLLRLATLTHVQMHHGDSDKASSTSRLLRLYDHHLVAGRAAVDRLAAAGVIRSAEEATVIGRPIASALDTRPVDSATPTVLYAPTWEGYHRDNSLSSVGGGPSIVAALLAKPGIKVTVRPHPLTGRFDESMRRRLTAMRHQVEDAGGRNRFDDDPAAESAVAALDEADVLITDVSGMLSDFLYTGRPIVVVDVQGRGEEELATRYPAAAAAYVVKADLSDLYDKLSAALGDDPLASRRAAMATRVLGDLGGDATTFPDALKEISGPQKST